MNEYLIALGFKEGDQPSPEEVKKAWKVLCKIHHPDKDGEAEEFRRITHAYNMISNPKYRYEQTNKPSAQNLDMRMQVAVSFEQAFFGHKLILNFGKMEMDEAHHLMQKDMIEIESLTVDIPAGSMAGGDIAFPGKGIKCGDNAGHVIVMVAVNPHAKFRADPRGNIVAAERFPLDTLVKGGSVEIQTMFGLRTVKIKPGSKPGDSIAVKKAGCGGADHVITLDAIYPTSEELKGEAWEGLDINWNIDAEIKKEQEEEAALQRRFFEHATFTFTSTSGTF